MQVAVSLMSQYGSAVIILGNVCIASSEANAMLILICVCFLSRTEQA